MLNEGKTIACAIKGKPKPGTEYLCFYCLAPDCSFDRQNIASTWIYLTKDFQWLLVTKEMIDMRVPLKQCYIFSHSTFFLVDFFFCCVDLGSLESKGM